MGTTTKLYLPPSKIKERAEFCKNCPAVDLETNSCSLGVEGEKIPLIDAITSNYFECPKSYWVLSIDESELQKFESTDAEQIFTELFNHIHGSQ